MRRISGREVWWTVLFLGLVTALGFMAGHGRRNVTSAPDAASLPLKNSDSAPQADPPAHVEVRKAPKAVPADLTSLNGKEFVDALPSLETLARSGNLDAARVLYQRLRSCVGFDDTSDEVMRSHENADYQRQIAISRQIHSDHPDRPVNPIFSERSLEQAHESRVKAAVNQSDLCKGLTPQQIEKYLDWAQFALERHDRQTILEAALPGNIGAKGVERVRNAERLIEIAQIERDDLNNLIAGGDLAALEQAAYAYSYGSDSMGLLQREPELAYTYAYALSLAGGFEDDLPVITGLMESLANGRPINVLLSAQQIYAPLSAEQIDAARVRGLALFQSCCASGAHN